MYTSGEWYWKENNCDPELICDLSMDVNTIEMHFIINRAPLYVHMVRSTITSDERWIASRVDIISDPNHNNMTEFPQFYSSGNHDVEVWTIVCIIIPVLCTITKSVLMVLMSFIIYNYINNVNNENNNNSIQYNCWANYRNTTKFSS